MRINLVSKLLKRRQLLLLRKSVVACRNLLLDVSVILLTARNAHELRLLNAHRQRQRICAARAWLATAILAMRCSHIGGKLANFCWRGCLKALITKMATLSGATEANVVSRKSVMANVARKLFGLTHALTANRYSAKPRFGLIQQARLLLSLSCV